MNKELNLALLLSEHDKYLLPTWLNHHRRLVESEAQIIIGVDGTLEGIPEIGCEIFECPLNNDFALARNAILNKCKKPYVLFLDADELLHPFAFNMFTAKHLQDLLKDKDYTHFIELNIFGGTIVDYPTYHAVLMKNTVRFRNNSPYVDASPGCHEKPIGNPSQLAPPQIYQILHIKDKWNGNFRNKGYQDQNQESAQANLRAKIKETVCRS